jgi:ABC-type antimicrobial peptide transport system permease subunit
LKWKDYIRLGWDQLARRKVVTALCALGIAIGSSSIIVALAFGESLAHYSTQQMNSFMKMDEITVNPGYIPPPSGEGEGTSVPVSSQMLDLIRTFPGVQSVASFNTLNYYSFTVDETKQGDMELIATDLAALKPFGYELQQGSLSELDQTVVIDYAVTFDLYDERTARIQMMLNGSSDRFNGEQAPISFPLYQKTILINQTIQSSDGNVHTASFPLRVVGVLQKPDTPVNNYRHQKKAYISHHTAELLKQAFSGANEENRGDSYEQTIIKVLDVKSIPTIEALISKIHLSSNSNLYRQDEIKQEFAIVRLIFAGVGLFVLFVASLSIVVAMTMATHQRRRQIGIMKVLGANLSQIRNMFMIESMLLGFLGGAIGILLSYWVIWTINIVLVRFSGQGVDSEILFISLWILPVGLLFAVMTGVLSGLYPAIKASRTDALSAIKRE